MGKKYSKGVEVTDETPDGKLLEVSPDASVDFPVLVESLDKEPYHKTGERFRVGSKNAEKLVDRGWVIIVKEASMIALFVIASIGSFAQTSVIAPLYNATNTYSLAKLQAATITQDTVTDTGTGALYVKRIAGPGVVTIQVNVQKVSGTVAGTITLSGSLDGVTYVALNTQETQTALATATLANTSGTVAYSWRLSSNPYLYYKVGTAGGTTTVYYMTAWILKH